ncbi:hypothetical protein COCVIDRAFT_40767 [Bipolaris victoriae FI3]|uniref:Metallo-beta-lactamase domain-containing protein n=1 Tax=Bipolaris victoriae (strain FI3) TaxID=930091 RepID=W7ECM2_BIPV3|nr:hypothetical protein COCVIDRAFT_40767 [Bipolaris victoriae FI3]
MTEPDTSSDLPTLRIFCPIGTTGIYAYYEGRTCPWRSLNWYDETLALGVAAYSIVSGDSALLFDAGLTPAYGAHMLAHVRSLGARSVKTIYSYFHADHIARASALRDTKIVAHGGTQERMRQNAEKLRNPDEGGGPSIDVVFPTETYEKSLSLRVGDIVVELHNFHIHTADSTLLFLPDAGLVFAGDMLGDTVTYISEPEDLKTQLQELERMAQLPMTKIFPAHGSPDRIKAGGFNKSLIDATIQNLKDVVKDDLMAGRLIFFEAYEGVHQENIESMKEIRKESTANMMKRSGEGNSDILT